MQKTGEPSVKGIQALTYVSFCVCGGDGHPRRWPCPVLCSTATSVFPSQITSPLRRSIHAKKNEFDCCTAS